jgi:hypothetical protein
MKRFLLSALLLFAAITIFTASGFTGDNYSNEEQVNHLFKNDGEKYFRFTLPGFVSLDELGRSISIDKVTLEGVVYAYANRKGFSAFLDFGISYEILPHPGEVQVPLHMKSSVNVRDINEWDFYPTYDAYVDMMYQFAADYPSLCQVTSIGTTNQGRELLVARISDNVGMEENEPQFLYTSSIHGDETTGYILMLRLIDYLLSNYNVDSRITDMVNGIDIFINPLANPDGTYHGGNSTVQGAYRFNANWIDLNRNYPDPEDGPHPDGEDWQIETQHFMAFAEAKHFVASTNFHGGEVVCNYPFDTWPRLAADDAWWKYVCHEYADTVHANCPWGYMTGFDNGITNGYAWYTVAGGRQDYMNYFHQCREFTLEISTTKLLETDSLPYYWNYNYRSILNYIEQSSFGIRGTVKDSVTGWPVEAEVFITLHELDSSWVYSKLPTGNFHRLVYAGNYTVRFSAPGYITKFVQNVNVVNRQATVLDVRLVPEEYAIVDNNLVSSSIDIYPNPMEGTTLHFKSDLKMDAISLLDCCGKEIEHFSIDPSTTGIRLGNLPQGLYFVRFETEKGTGIKKVLINR